MKIKKMTVFILLFTVVLASVSSHFLNQTPLTFFVLKNETAGIKAYQVNGYFAVKETDFEELSLSPRQVLDGEKVATDKNLVDLKQWSKSFGRFDFVVGLWNPDIDFVSDWNEFFNSTNNDAVSDLSRLDKRYLALLMKPKLSNGTSNEPVQIKPVKPLATVEPTSVISTKTPTIEPIVRVEILNGCGIKGAADRMAGRITSDRITVKNGGNAVNFAYVHTQVLSATGDVPASLTKALSRLGLADIKGVKSVDVPKDYDVVLIVGKDFRKLKGN